MLRLIIDTDTAGDDTTALMLAMKSGGAKVEAITINCGNVAFDQQVENALYTVQVAGRDVPVYPGARRPLLRDWRTVEDVHGRDGMGDSFFPKATRRPERKNAVNAMVDLLNDSPGEITVVEQAPMTNLALALRTDPGIAKKVKHLYFMGGTNQALGNVTPAAEYNIWADPDAAKIVLHSGIPTTMVGWEICVRHGMLGPGELDEISGFGTEESRFFTAVNRVARRFVRETMGVDAVSCPDSITMAMVLDRGIVEDSHDRYVDVDNESELSRGATYVDHYGVLKKAPNVEVVYRASERGFKAMLFRMLRGESF